MKITKKIARVLFVALIPITICGFYLYSGTDCVSGKTCSEHWEEWDQANMTYSTRYDSVYFGLPTTCEQECAPFVSTPSQFAQCVSDCRITRNTELAEASIDLFIKAGRTCVPYSIEQCEMARFNHDSCLLNYRYWEIEDPEQSMAVFEQYYACRIASKVDFCA